MNNPAPIALFVYNRLNHLKQTIDSLIKNTIAKDSDLYIFSDSFKDELDKERVKEVRKYIKTIKHFKRIEILEQKENLGLSKSIIEGSTQLLNLFGKVIVVEDDLILSQYFLEFINRALIYYEDEEQIISVTGYSFPINFPNSYNESVYILPRISSWGWGITKHQWDSINWDDNYYYKIISDKNLRHVINSSGYDVLPMLYNYLRKKNRSWAVRATISASVQNKFTIYPTKSFVMNIGNDNSGTNSRKTSKFNVSLIDNTINYNFTKPITPNSLILKEFLRFSKPSLIRRTINFLKFGII